MSLSSDFVELAQDLIDMFGVDITVRTLVFGSLPDVSLPWVQGTTTNSDQVTTGVFLDENDKLVPGDWVKQANCRVLCPALSTRPQPGGQVLCGQIVWSIAGVMPVSVNGTDVMYEMRVE